MDPCICGFVLKNSVELRSRLEIEPSKQLAPFNCLLLIIFNIAAWIKIWAMPLQNIGASSYFKHEAPLTRFVGNPRTGQDSREMIDGLLCGSSFIFWRKIMIQYTRGRSPTSKQRNPDSLSCTLLLFFLEFNCNKQWRRTFLEISISVIPHRQFPYFVFS